MPNCYLLKYQYFNKKQCVQKWTHCPFLDTKSDITLYVYIKATAGIQPYSGLDSG